jgi:DNA replication protein DnaC
VSATASELAYLSRALKAPRISAVSGRLAERARDEGWAYEVYLAAVLGEEVAARDSHGGSARVKAARFPAVKTLDDFDFTVQTSVSRQLIAHLAQLDFLAEAKNVVFLGPPGTGKTHLSIALAVQAARRGHRVAFATAHQWVNRLGAPSAPGGSTRSWSGSAGFRSSSSTRSATSRSIRRPRHCSSRSSVRGTSGDR